jgi:CHAT domain-containing protein/Tfp pilus assembly protein PilF
VGTKLRIAIFLMIYALTGLAQQSANSSLDSEIARAEALWTQGSRQEVQKIYESLLPTLRAQGPSPKLGRALLLLGEIANAAGNYDRAVALAGESAATYQKVHDKAGEAHARNDAGMAYMNAGNYAQAENELQTALKLNSGTGDVRSDIMLLYNLGNVYYYQAKYSEAFRSYQSALQKVENSASESWAPALRHVTLLNMATLYQRLGNDQRAIEIYKDLEGSPQLRPEALAHIYANLGILYRHLGDTEKALETYRKAQQLFTEKKDADGQLGVLKNIGIVFGLNLGRLQDALKTFDAALALAEKTKNRREIMQAHLYRGEILRRMQKPAEAEAEFKVALEDAEQLGTAEEQWKALYGLGRIAEETGHNAAAEAKFRDAVTKIEGLRSKLQFSRLKTDFFADKRDVYDALIKLLVQRNDAPAAFEYMERSRARVFQDRFFADKNAPQSTSLQSVQARLDGNTAMVEFWTGEDAVAAIWITKDSAGIAQTRVSSDQAAALVRFISNLPDNLGTNWQTDFQQLAALVPTGITAFSDNRFHHILIVPDGFLSLIPFELVSSDSGGALIEKHDVTYLPSAAILFRGRSRQTTNIHFPWQEQLLAFGDPAMTGTGDNALISGLRSQGAGALPSSAEEIREIAAMSAGRTRLFLGADDRKVDFFAETRSRAALLHVSTHAIADMDNPERSRLLFSPDQAGAGNNYVFLKELYDLDLRGTSLATLSACDTERGRLVPGEGVQAFSRALLSAGAGSTVTTLWRVPDQPTEEFMKQFYFLLLKKHLPKAEALRLTKLKFMHSGTELSHPRYWAAFVLNGDGADPVPRFLPWQIFPLAFALLILVGILFWYSKKRKNIRSSSREAIAVQR